MLLIVNVVFGMTESGLPLASHEMLSEPPTVTAPDGSRVSRVIGWRHCVGGSLRRCRDGKASDVKGHASGTAGVLIGDLSRGQDPDFFARPGPDASAAGPLVVQGRFSRASAQTRGRLRAWNGNLGAVARDVSAEADNFVVLNRSAGSHDEWAPSAKCSGRTAADTLARTLFEAGVLLVKSAGNENKDLVRPTVAEIVARVRELELQAWAGTPLVPRGDAKSTTSGSKGTRVPVIGPLAFWGPAPESVITTHAELYEWVRRGPRDRWVPVDDGRMADRYTDDDREHWAKPGAWTYEASDRAVQLGRQRLGAVRDKESVSDILKLIYVRRFVRDAANPETVDDPLYRADRLYDASNFMNVLPWGVLSCTRGEPGHWCNTQAAGSEGAGECNINSPGGPYSLVVGARSLDGGSYGERYSLQSMGGWFTDSAGVRRRRTAVTVTGVQPFAWAPADRDSVYQPDFNATSCATPTVAAVLGLLERRFGQAGWATAGEPGALQALALALGDGWDGVNTLRPSRVVRGLNGVSGAGSFRADSIRRLLTALQAGGAFGPAPGVRLRLWSFALEQGEAITPASLVATPLLSGSNGVRLSVALFFTDAAYLRTGKMAAVDLRVLVRRRLGGNVLVDATDAHPASALENRRRLLFHLDDQVHDVAVSVSRAVTGGTAEPVTFHVAMLEERL